MAVWPQQLRGYAVGLRAVEEGDAAFVVEQRRLPRARAFLGDTPADVGLQTQWIAKQRGRPDDYYFLCENDGGQPLGTIGLYDCFDAEAEWGRFVVREDTKAAPACLLLLLTFAFAELGLQRLTCTTLVRNDRAVSFYERAGFCLVGQSSRRVVVGGREEPCVTHAMHARAWPAAKLALQAAALAKAGRVREAPVWRAPVCHA